MTTWVDSELFVIIIISCELQQCPRIGRLIGQIGSTHMLESFMELEAGLPLLLVQPFYPLVFNIVACQVAFQHLSLTAND